MTKQDLLERLKKEFRFEGMSHLYWVKEEGYKAILADIEKGLPAPPPEGTAVHAFLRLSDAIPGTYSPSSWDVIANRIIAKISALEAEVEAARVQAKEANENALVAERKLAGDLGWQDKVLTEFCRIAAAVGTGTGGGWTRRADQIIAAIEARKNFDAEVRKAKIECSGRARDAFQRVGDELDLDLGDLPWDQKAVAVIDAIDDMKETVGDLLADEPCDDEFLPAELKTFPVELPPGHFLMLARTDEFFPSPVTQTGEACDGC